MSAKASDALTGIPVGHYHRMMEEGHPVRRAWHLLKFQRVLELCDTGPGPLLDVGCFAGSLLSLADEQRFPEQLGVDILPDQVAFANASFGTPFRRFEAIADFDALAKLPQTFAYATSVEVIEHLKPQEIEQLLLALAHRLTLGSGRVVLSTPNYVSTWPVLEALLNRFSDVDYSEQHITKFTYFGFEQQLRAAAPEAMRYFDFEVKTTTHLLTPFLAAPMGVERAMALASKVPHSAWQVPFGNLVLVRLKRNDVKI